MKTKNIVKIKQAKEKKCFCGHLRKKHGLYVNSGVNKKGSRYVCQQDGCYNWNLCDLKND